LNAKRPRPPVGRNGADLVPIITKQMPKDWGEKILSSNWEPLRDVPTNARYCEEVIAEARRECAAAKDAITTARKFKDYPSGFREMHPETDPYQTLLPQTQNTRDIPKLLRWDAVLAVEDGDRPRAADSILAALNASRSIGSEPSLISQLFRIATRRIAWNTLEWALAHGELPAERLEKLQPAWVTDAEEPLILFGVRGERAMMDAMMENLQNGTLDPRDWLKYREASDNIFGRFGWRHYRFRLSGERAWALGKFNRYITLANKPVEEQVRLKDGWEIYIDPDYAVARKVFPPVSMLARACWRSVAEMRCAAMGIACERFRMKHGHWPESLASLVPDYLPAVPLDPFDGKPLKMKSLADGVVIYSIGLDGTDDGGDLRRDNNPDGKDEGFRLWNVKDRRIPTPPRPKPPPDDEP
jgi:hypothetical protein